MSASTEKKLRRAARETGSADKAAAAKKEATKKKQRKLWWVLGIAAFAVILALLLVFTSSAFRNNTTALTIKDREYSPAEVNYYYATQYYYFVNQYGDLTSFLGLDTSYGLSGLSTQPSSYYDGTWRDYFLAAAKTEMARNQALFEYGEANGVTLTEQEVLDIDNSFVEVASYSALNGMDIDSYFSQGYGAGVTMETAYMAAVESAIADKTAKTYAAELEYTTEELEEYYASFNGEKDYFDYAYYFVKAEEVSTTAADGTVTEDATEETLAAAKTMAEAILEQYNKSNSTSVEEALETALAVAAKEGASSTVRTHTAGSEIDVGDAGKEWLKAEGRKLGDATVIEQEGNGYFVICFIGRDNNDYNTRQVRHILITAVASEDGTISDGAKADAKMRAEELLAQWEAGEKTEESFAELAKNNSEDAETKNNGGLLDAVARKATVQEFNDFCYDENRKYGDTAVVYGENGYYTGYHVMFYIGEGENCRLNLSRIDLINADTEAWITELQEGYRATDGFGLRFVG